MKKRRKNKTYTLTVSKEVFEQSAKWYNEIKELAQSDKS